MRYNTEISISLDLESKSWNIHRTKPSLAHSLGERETGKNETSVDRKSDTIIDEKSPVSLNK